MKHLFIINPIAGGKDQSFYLSDQIHRLMEHCPDTYEIYITSSPMDACTKTREEARTGKDLRVYACGGDGTLNEVINGAMGFPSAAVAHYPCGTGNDFVKLFGPESMERFRDLAALVEGRCSPLDIIECNGRYSANICSVGIDARVGIDVHRFSSLPGAKGKIPYVLSLISNLFKGINRQFKITVGGEELQGSFALICACNGRYYGGGFNPVPDALPDDGLLEFLIVKHVPVSKLIAMINRFSSGRFRELPEYIRHVRGRYLEVESEREMVINVDGEGIYDRRAYFRLLPRALKLILPVGVSMPGAKIKETAVI